MAVTVHWFGDKVKALLMRQGEDGCRRAAEFMADRAQRYAPVDTGFLRNSIDVDSSMNNTVFHVIARARYARYVEFGSLHGGSWIPPNPFMRKALADAKAAFPTFFADARLQAPGAKNTLQNLGVTVRK